MLPAVFSGGAVPGKAELCPGIEYCGRNWAKFTPKTPGNCPFWNPSGNWPAGVTWVDPVAPAEALVANRDRIERSDICNLKSKKKLGIYKIKAIKVFKIQ